MKRATLVLLVVPLIALWIAACDDAPVGPEAVDSATTEQVAQVPIFKKDAPQPQPQPVSLSGWTLVRAESGSIDVNESGYKTVQCPSGKAVISGGYKFGAEHYVTGNHPVGPSGWNAAVVNKGEYASYIYVYAVCVDSTFQE